MKLSRQVGLTKPTSLLPSHPTQDEERGFPQETNDVGETAYFKSRPSVAPPEPN